MRKHLILLILCTIRAFSFARSSLRCASRDKFYGGMMDIEDIIVKYKYDDTLKYSFSEVEKDKIKTNLLNFYDSSRRLLPWRGDTVNGIVPPAPSAYGTWVSEIMLQQTRVETVISYWYKWMERFPNVQVLASATPEEVNTIWAGLGYYRRAQSLLKGAQKVCSDYNGVIPSDLKGLLSIPGIGPYTAGAISSIAYKQPNGLVDGNVIRVMSRLRAMKLEQGTPAMDKQCWSLAESIVDVVRPGDLNQALMELGATVCKPLNPSCATCPVSEQCHANMLSASTSVRPDSELPDKVTYFPRKIPKKKAKEVTLSVLILVNSEKKYLFVKRDSKGLLANQWEFPTIETWREGKQESVGDDDNEEEEKEEEVVAVTMSKYDVYNQFAQYLQEKMSIELVDGSVVDAAKVTAGLCVKKHLPLEPLVHIFSHERHTMTLNLFEVEGSSSSESSSSSSSSVTMKEHKWMSEAEIKEIGITSGCKKIIEIIKKTNEKLDSNSKNGKKKQVQTKLNFSPKTVLAGGAGEGSSEATGDKKRKIETISVD